MLTAVITLNALHHFFSNFVFFNFYFGTVFFNEAPSEGFNDEAEPVYVNTYINTHKYMLRVSLWWTFMRFPYNIVQLQFDVDILIYTKKSKKTLDRMLLPTHSHTCMAKRRTKHWHISQWPLHEMIACHYCPFLKKNKWACGWMLPCCCKSWVWWWNHALFIQAKFDVRNARAICGFVNDRR